ncbi:MAG: hypothetical protein Q4G65_17755 [bacterium]|nr:hypothetical protein [bacterium]
MVGQLEKMMGAGTMPGRVVNRGLLALLVCGGVLSAEADEAEGETSPRMCTYDASSGVTDLTIDSAWVGGVVPGAGDVAVFDGATPATLNLGETTEWAGIVRTNVVNELSLVAPESGVLRLGAQGWVNTSDNENYNRTYLQVDVEAVADQEWTTKKKKTPCLGRRVGGTGTVSLTGVGNVMFYAPVTASVSVGSQIVVFSVEGATWNPAPTIQKGAQLALLPTSGSWNFSDLFPDGAFANQGRLSFGPQDNNGTFKAYTNTFLLGTGDSLKRNGGTSSDRNEGAIWIQDADVVSDGADVTQNIWFNLRNGSWTQKAGETAMAYGAFIGRGSPMNFGLKRQRLNIEGGTFTSRRLNIGLGNTDECPAEAYVSGGIYTSTSPTESQTWAFGLSLALRSASGESREVDGKQVAFSESEFPAGRLEITGGTVKTPALIFGNDNDTWGSGYHEKKAAARAALRGGELQIGPKGVRTAVCWKPDSTQDASWYDFVLSGGTLKFVSSDTDSTADMRLSSRDGGASIQVDAGTTAVKISGGISGDGGFRKTGAGGLCLTGANDYTGRTEVVEGKLSVGDNRARAIWTADDYLSAAAGTSALPWATRGGIGGGPWSFTHGTAIPGTEGTTPPTVSPTGLNGRSALAFDGSNSAFLTGNAEQPFSDKAAFTVSLVFQTEPGFTGCSSESILKATQILGTSIDDSSRSTMHGRQFGISINAEGCLGCGLYEGSWKDKDGKIQKMEPENIWFTEQTVNDGKPHVFVWSWDSNGVHQVQLDGRYYKQTFDPNGVGTIQKTRIVLGVGERQQSKTARFRGLVGDVRMSSVAYGPVRLGELAQKLGMKYGVEAYADAKPYADAPSPAAAEVPAPTAAWSADTLAQQPGESVAEWREKDGKGADSSSTWTFTSALAEAILKSQKDYPGRATSPVIAADSVNGHKFVSFNGVDAGLGLTGNKTTPAGAADGLTVAAVVRFTGYGTGGGSCGIRESAPFLSQGYTPGSGTYQWGFGLTGASRALVSGRNGNTLGTARSRRRFLDDGAPHVLVMTYPKKGTTDEKVTLSVDGVACTSVVFSVTGTMQNTRILLGAGEIDGKARYAPIDVAAFAFWKNTVLTADQIAQLNRDLCAEYGVYNEGEARYAAAGQQRSQEIYVHDGAAYGGYAWDDFTVFPGQTIWGDGRTEGGMTLAPGAAVKVSTQHALTIGQNVTFQDGARLTAAFDGAGDLRPVSVTGSVLVQGGIEVEVVAEAESTPPGGTLLTWTGTLVGEPTFTVTDRGFDVRVDVANKCIKLVRTSGTMLIVR